MTAIDFWFSIGSTYSYLTVMRLGGVARDRGVSFTWRSFNVRHIMVEQNNVPFKGKPVKEAYMWRDIERRAPVHGLAPTLPAPYPCPELPYANQVATLAAQEGWLEDYARATYRNWFERGQPNGEEPNLSNSLAAIGQDPERVTRAAQSATIRDALARETRTAQDLGVFGSPTFAVGGELFWGDDRLDDAIAWARHGRLG
ncbi:2-hydroxychromene-2-carboxylate isomerase [Sinisalibacter lacisalsi]|uniref:2-hydroxychromene-2-carboxylate isomerase n=1 Tax=Sinisalibacter lacisalsi TaxID=1526570 RepID=A0ABQ1QKN7_9RHOB|nr:2-hydroxychromene-2-carboxylate isomerase [Sinisalibacter lacisalsi]GGD29430.1 2-hydroxychromene-2-carboxylate isomerase [Sinisalibacter lacisalsi]